jgi:hypothetical protein
MASPKPTAAPRCLGALSSAVIAIAFVGRAKELGDAFYLFALALLPPVFLLQPGWTERVDR